MQMRTWGSQRDRIFPTTPTKGRNKLMNTAMHASAEAIANPFDSFLHNDRSVPVLAENSQDWTKMLKDSEQMKFL